MMAGAKIIIKKKNKSDCFVCVQERPPPSTAGPSLFGRTAIVCVIHIETTIEWTLLGSTINIHRFILLFVDCQRASTSINVDIYTFFAF